MTTTAATRRCTVISDLPKSYVQLCSRYVPRPIHNRAELKTASKYLSEIAGLTKQTKGQRDYEHALCLFIKTYETKLYSTPTIDPVTLLNSLMAAHQMTPNDISEIIGTSSAAVSKILRRERPIKPAEAAKLGDRFRLNSTVFLGI